MGGRNRSKNKNKNKNKRKNKRKNVKPDVNGSNHENVDNTNNQQVDDISDGDNVNTNVSYDKDSKVTNNQTENSSQNDINDSKSTSENKNTEKVENDNLQGNKKNYQKKIRQAKNIMSMMNGRDKNNIMQNMSSLYMKFLPAIVDKINIGDEEEKEQITNELKSDKTKSMMNNIFNSLMDSDNSNKKQAIYDTINSYDFGDNSDLRNVFESQINKISDADIKTSIEKLKDPAITEKISNLNANGAVDRYLG